MQRRAQRLIHRYGQPVTITLGDDTSYSGYAVIQPFRHRGKMYQGLEYIPAGAVDESRFLYIGKSDIAFGNQGYTRILAGGAQYYVEWSQPYYIKEETVYMRAILRICS